MEKSYLKAGVSFGTATVLNIGRIVRSERGGSQEEVHAGLEGVEAAP